VLLLGVPVALVFVNAFRMVSRLRGKRCTTPEAQHAFWLTFVMVAVAVPLNTIFGVLAALAIVRQRFRGRALLNAAIDLPFAVSPWSVGLALLARVRQPRWVDRRLARRARRPSHLLGARHDPRHDVRLAAVRRCARRSPCCARSAPSRSRRPRRSGAGPLRPFSASRCPAIRWGVAYGVVLTAARALGEFGAVSIVSGKLSGQTETAPLFVEGQFQRFNETGAYAASVVLALSPSRPSS
jgi:sulfate transport system permease protein